MIALVSEGYQWPVYASYFLEAGTLKALCQFKELRLPRVNKPKTPLFLTYEHRNEYMLEHITKHLKGAWDRHMRSNNQTAEAKKSP